MTSGFGNNFPSSAAPSGNAAAGTGGGFGFGQALGTTPQSSGLLFGSVGQLATTTQAVNFNLQTGQTSNTALPLYGSQQANAIRPTGFSFQPPQTTQQSGFQLGSNTAGGGLSLGQSQLGGNLFGSQMPTSNAFNVAPVTSSTPAQFGMQQPAVQSSGNPLTFGQPPSQGNLTTPASTTPSFGLSSNTGTGLSAAGPTFGTAGGLNLGSVGTGAVSTPLFGSNLGAGATTTSSLLSGTLGAGATTTTAPLFGNMLGTGAVTSSSLFSGTLGTGAVSTAPLFGASSNVKPGLPTATPTLGMTTSSGLGGGTPSVLGTGTTQGLGLGAATTSSTIRPTFVSQTAATSLAPTNTAPGLGLGSGIRLGASVSAAASTLPSSTQFLPKPSVATQQQVTSTATSAPVSIQKTVGGTTTTTSSATGPSGDNPEVTMSYRQLEEAVNRWTLELEEQEKIFIQQATQVNAWDRVLVENGDKITELNVELDRIKIDQNRLDQELEFIVAQQREIEEALEPLEQSVNQLPPLSGQSHVDNMREHTYTLAENVDAQLKRMGQDLKDVVERLNSSTSSYDSSDPMVQVTKILNAHMDSLQWVDQNIVNVQKKVEELSKVAENRKSLYQHLP